MKAISLWQPYASAIALGLKGIETRPRRTHYRGPLAIHAAQRCTAELRDRFAYEFLFDFRAVGVPYFEQLPLGAIVAVCDVLDCKPVEDLAGEVSDVERRLGDFTPGRFGWVLGNIRQLSMPIFISGKQGFFNVEDSLL
jgi:hypothetical protein